MLSRLGLVSLTEQLSIETRCRRGLPVAAIRPYFEGPFDRNLYFVVWCSQQRIHRSTQDGSLYYQIQYTASSHALPIL
jgi:hypothetical protein